MPGASITPPRPDVASGAPEMALLGRFDSELRLYKRTQPRLFLR